MLLECSVTSVTDLCCAVYAMGVAVDYPKTSGRCVPEVYKMLDRCASFLSRSEEGVRGRLLDQKAFTLELKR